MSHVCGILFNSLSSLMIGNGNDKVKVLKEKVGFSRAQRYAHFPNMQGMIKEKYESIHFSEQRG